MRERDRRRRRMCRWRMHLLDHAPPEDAEHARAAVKVRQMQASEA